nr:hypothetical protein [uncultured Ottowia sp.]
MAVLIRLLFVKRRRRGPWLHGQKDQKSRQQAHKLAKAAAFCADNQKHADAQKNQHGVPYPLEKAPNDLEPLCGKRQVLLFGFAPFVCFLFVWPHGFFLIDGAGCQCALSSRLAGRSGRAFWGCALLFVRVARLLFSRRPKKSKLGDQQPHRPESKSQQACDEDQHVLEHPFAKRPDQSPDQTTQPFAQRQQLIGCVRLLRGVGLHGALRLA